MSVDKTQNIMHDYLGNELQLYDKVCFAPAGAYAGIYVGVIEKFTTKKIVVRGKYNWRKMSGIDEKLYYTYSNQVLKIESQHNE